MDMILCCCYHNYSLSEGKKILPKFLKTRSLQRLRRTLRNKITSMLIIKEKLEGKSEKQNGSFETSVQVLAMKDGSK